jgi:hypothetical protein
MNEGRTTESPWWSGPRSRAKVRSASNTMLLSLPRVLRRCRSWSQTGCPITDTQNPIRFYTLSATGHSW